MTERFTLTNPKNTFQEMKCGIDDRGNTLTFNEVVDMLNDLNNEKESWRKSWIEELNNSEKQSKCILKLLNENEELKKEIQNLQAKLNILEQAITGDNKQ